MTTGQYATLLLITAALGYAVLYQVIRRAVTAGILDADRKKQQAEAERLRVIAERQRQGG